MVSYSRLKPHKGRNKPFEILPFIIALLVLALSVFWLDRFILDYLPPSSVIETASRSLRQTYKDRAGESEGGYLREGNGEGDPLSNRYLSFLDLLEDDWRGSYNRAYNHKDPFKPLKSYEEFMAADRGAAQGRNGREGSSLLPEGGVTELLTGAGIIDKGIVNSLRDRVDERPSHQPSPGESHSEAEPVEPDYGRYVAENLTLRGYVGRTGTAMALVEYKGETYIVEEGDLIADFKVKGILSEALLVEYKEKEYNISLGGEDE